MNSPVVMFLVLLAAACGPDTPQTTGSERPGSDDTAGGGASDSGDQGGGDDTGLDEVVEPSLRLATPAGTDAILLDAERGLMTWIDLTDPGDLSWVREQGLSLAYAGVVLEDWDKTDLSPELLATLAEGFAAVRAAGIKVVLRFTYTGEDLEDASLPRMERHISQLTELLQDNADVIYVVQAGFIGAWGEWHSSTSGNDTDEARLAVLEALLAAVPRSRMLQVRTPAFKRDLYGGPLAEEDAFSGDAAARIGQHNDCFLASDTDYGTYDEADPEVDKAFVAAETRFLPMGGETCVLNPPRTGCYTALSELSSLHWRFLNLLYHPDVLAGWQSEGCWEDIQRGLGHRLVLQEVQLSEGVSPGGRLHLVFTVANEGWGSLVNPRALQLSLSREGEEHELTVDPELLDPRRWEPGAPSTVDLVLQLPVDLSPGAWTLSLGLPDPKLPDDPRYAVRWAVAEESWSEASGRVLLQEALVVDPSWGGAVDPEATELAVLVLQSG